MDNEMCCGSHANLKEIIQIKSNVTRRCAQLNGMD